MTGGFKVKASPTQLFLDTSPVIPNVELVNVHPLIKHLFTKEMLTKAVDIPLSYSNKSLLSKLPKFDFKPGYSVSGKELQNIIHQDTFSTKNSKFSKDEEEANCSCGFGIKGDVKKRGNNENSTCSKSVFEQLIPCGKKRRKLSPYDKSKNVEPVHSFSPFQNGRSFSVKESNTGGRLDVVDRFKQNNFDTETREGTKSCQDLSEPSQESFYNSSRINQGCGSPIIHNTSSGTCKDSVKISSATTNCVSKEKNELSVSNNIKHQVKSRVDLVDRELEVSQ